MEKVENNAPNFLGGLIPMGVDTLSELMKCNVPQTIAGIAFKDVAISQVSDGELSKLDDENAGIAPHRLNRLKSYIDDCMRSLNCRILRGEEQTELLATLLFIAVKAMQEKTIIDTDLHSIETKLVTPYGVFTSDEVCSRLNGFYNNNGELFLFGCIVQGIMQNYELPRIEPYPCRDELVQKLTDYLSQIPVKYLEKSTKKIFNWFFMMSNCYELKSKPFKQVTVLSDIYKGKVPNVFEAAYQFQFETMRTAQALYDRGWTVIGSRFKAPKVKGWNTLERDELLAIADHDFQTRTPVNNPLPDYKANSINLRLSDNKVIALDCDFHSAELTSDFLSHLKAFYAKDTPLYTCKGSKGCKVFFSFTGDLSKLKRTLGSKVLLISDNGQLETQELELKKDVSTVYGLHSALIDNATGQLYDYVIYDKYGDYSHITEASPADLVSINQKQLNLIEQLYISLCAKYEGLTHDNRQPLANTAYANLIKSAVCAYMSGPAKARFNYTLDFYYLYRYLGLDDAISCIEYIERNKPLSKKDPSKLIAVCGQIKALLEANDKLAINSLVARFDSYCRPLKDLILVELNHKGENCKKLDLYDLATQLVKYQNKEKIITKY